jgi:septal ring factor EnvC (AmiA/AmiB activator)
MIAPAPSAAPRLAYILPVAGRIVTGFGEASSGGGLRARGITLATRPGAQVVAPAAGRVAFAGRYEGYGRIVILEHDGGWTTLVTGLAATAPAVGDTLVQGAPLGVAGRTIGVELRRAGEPVDVLAVVSGG